MPAEFSEKTLTELSWEAQTDGLLALYGDLAGTVPPAAEMPVTWDLDERPRRITRPC